MLEEDFDVLVNYIETNGEYQNDKYYLNIDSTSNPDVSITYTPSGGKFSIVETYSDDVMGCFPVFTFESKGYANEIAYLWFYNKDTYSLSAKVKLKLNIVNHKLMDKINYYVISNDGGIRDDQIRNYQYTAAENAFSTVDSYLNENSLPYFY